MKISIGRIWKKICTASMAIFAVVFSTAVVGGTGTATYHYHLHGQLAEESDTHVHGVPAHSDSSEPQYLDSEGNGTVNLAASYMRLTGGDSEATRQHFVLGVGLGNIEISGYLTLDLMGFNITGSGEGSAIKVLEGANFILMDSVGTGQITGGTSRIAGGVYVEPGATFTMEGGNITGNQAIDTDEELPSRLQNDDLFQNGVIAGGVLSLGTFIMNGGSITENSVYTEDQYYALAGGVVIAGDGTFEMNGGSIFENVNLGSTKYWAIDHADTSESALHYRALAGGILIYGSKYDSSTPVATFNRGEISFNENVSEHLSAGNVDSPLATLMSMPYQGFAGGIALVGSGYTYITGGTMIARNKGRYGQAIGITGTNAGWNYDEAGQAPVVLTISDGATITGHAFDITLTSALGQISNQNVIYMQRGRLEIEGGSIEGNTWTGISSVATISHPRVIGIDGSCGNAYIKISGGYTGNNYSDSRVYSLLLFSLGSYSRTSPNAALITGGYLGRILMGSNYTGTVINGVRMGLTIEGGYFSEDSGITETDDGYYFEDFDTEYALDTDEYTIQDISGNALGDPYYREEYPYAVYLRGDIGVRATVPNNPTYDAEAIKEGEDFTITSDMEDASYSYTYRSSDSTVDHQGLPTDAGTYTVTASIPIETGLDTSTEPYTYYDHSSGQTQFEITIDKADIQSSFFSYPQDEETTFTYNGTQQQPEVNMTPTVGTGAGDPSYAYSSSSSEYIEVSPIDSGTYYIWATVTEGDNYNAVDDPMYTGLSFRINGIDATPSYTPTTIEICVESTLSEVSLSEYDDENGTWSWDDPSVTVSGQGNSYSATYTPIDDSNYNSITVYVTVNVVGHDWGDWELVGDTHSRTCNRCGTTESGDHSWGLWEVSIRPTESSEGLLQRECSSEPGHTESFTLPVLSETNGYTLTTSDPDCEDSGEKVYTYEKDGQTFTFYVDIPATGHQWGDWTITIDPTQDNVGEAQRVCENDSSHTDTITLPALGSDSWTETGREDPDCESAGWVEWTYTPSEGGSITFTEILDPLGHDWGDWESKGDGTHTHVCQNDSSHTDTENCSGGSITDFGNGTHGYICDDCGGRYGVSSHIWGDWHIDTEPTESQQGTIYRICSDCYAREESTLPTLGSGEYSYQVITQPDCETEGMGRYTIQVDDTTLTIDVVIPATGHNYGSWTSNGDGTHSRVCQNDSDHVETDSCTGGNLQDLGDGTHGNTCDVCEGNYNVSSHNYGGWVSGGTNGHYQVCDDCNAHSDTEDHNYGDWTITDPTTSSPGSASHTCEDCGYQETETIPALDPDDPTFSYMVVKDSTCTDDGLGRYTYETSDGQEFTFDVVISATGHDWDDIWVSDGNGKHHQTCLNDSSHTYIQDCYGGTLHDLGNGTHGYTCEVCHDDYGASAHNYGNDWIADGSDGHYQVCHVCQTHSSTVDHTYGNWTITQTPTENQDGLLSLICSDCGYTETQVLPAFGGSDAEGFYTIERFESTCTVAGRIDYYYVIEGNRTLIGSVSLPLLDHTFSGSWIADGSNGHYQLCEVCGNSSANVDHSFGEWNVVVEATETQDGEQHRYCEHCGHLQVQTLPATGAESNPGIDGGTTGGVDSGFNYRYLWLIPPLLFLMIVVTTGVIVRTSDR